MANKCELCGQECKTAQGLAGHKRFRHPSANPMPDYGDDSSYTREEMDAVFNELNSILIGLVVICGGVRDIVRELKSNDLTLNWRMTELEKKTGV